MKLGADNPTTTISRIVIWGTCDTDKPRVRILCQGLRENGIDVVICRSDIWTGVNDKSQIEGTRGWLRLLTRILLAYPALILRYFLLPRHDWVLLLYPAIPDIFVIRLLAWFRRTPVALDWFLSAYDTVVLDRQLISRSHPIAWCIFAAEWLAARLADCIFMDTRTHAARMEHTFGLPCGHIRSVWVGAEIERFQPRPDPKTQRPGSTFTVFFYGQFIPLHGISTIIEAAVELRNEDIQWILVGKGQEDVRIKSMLARTPLPRLKWIEWVEYSELNDWLQVADVCLGIFGTSGKAASVIPNKVFQIIAAQRPLITRDSPAIRELLADDGACVHLIEAADPKALAQAVQSLHERRRRDLWTDRCHAGLRSSISPAAIGDQCLRVLAGNNQ